MHHPYLKFHLLLAIFFIAMAPKAWAQFNGPQAFIGFFPSSISPGQSTTLAWSANDPSASSCVIRGVPGVFFIAPNGSISLTPSTSLNATIECDFSIGSGATASLSVISPAVDISFSPSSIRVGQSSTLRWNTTGFDSCSSTGDFVINTLSGNMNVSPSNDSDLTVTLTCVGSSGTVSRTANLTVSPPAPSITVFASPPFLFNPGFVSIIWSSFNTDSCFSSAVGTIPTSGAFSTFINSSQFITISCSGSGGSVTGLVFVNVSSPFAPAPVNEQGSTVETTDTLSFSQELDALGVSIEKSNSQSIVQDMNSDGFDDLILVDLQKQTLYIFMSDHGRLTSVSKSIEGVSSLAQLRSLSIDKAGSISVSLNIQQ